MFFLCAKSIFMFSLLHPDSILNRKVFSHLILFNKYIKSHFFQKGVECMIPFIHIDSSHFQSVHLLM